MSKGMTGEKAGAKRLVLDLELAEDQRQSTEGGGEGSKGETGKDAGAPG